MYANLLCLHWGDCMAALHFLRKLCSKGMSIPQSQSNQGEKVHEHYVLIAEQ